MAQIWAAVRFNFMGFFKSPRTIIAFWLSAVVCWLLSGRVYKAVTRFGKPMQAAEPFIWTFGDAQAVLLVSLLLIFLFADLPKISAFTPFCLVRMTRSRWLIAQFFYIVLVTLLYVMFVLAVTILLCAKNAFPGNLWSETAAILGYSGVGKELNVPSTVKVMESVSPYGCMLQVGILLFGYSLTLGFLVFLGNLMPGGKYGMFLALGYSLYGFLLEPEVLGTLMGLEKYELYRVRSLVGWISPLNNAVYGMHDFGYDNLPSVGQSLAGFAVLTALAAVLCGRLAKRYNFEFSGSSDG